MKYTLKENSIHIVESGLDADTYSASISLLIFSIDEIAPPFIKTIEVVSTNAMTGFEVDAQRVNAINDFMFLINK